MATRAPGETDDPTLLAIMAYVSGMIDAGIREGLGFWKARTANEARVLVREEFITAMQKASSDGGN